MAERVAGPEIERLIQLLARLPGLGPRSARRAALHLIRKREELLGAARRRDADRAREASSPARSAAMSTRCDPCTICRDARRDPTMLVVVEIVADLWALERAGAIRARYHVLGGTLSPLDGVGPQRSQPRRRWSPASPTGEVSEVILAVNATVDGQTTAHYITDLLLATMPSR